MSFSLILLPGLAGDAAMWRAQLDALADHAPRVSDAHMRRDTIEEMASAVLHEHEGELALCGASMGAMVAMEAARQAPDRVRGLALLGATARAETPQMRSLRETAVALFEQGRLADVIEPNLRFAFHPDSLANAALVSDYLSFVYRAGAAQLARQNRAVIARPDARAHLPQLRCPTLVMCGRQDQLTPPDCAREIASLAPGARLQLVDRCGHMLTMEQPKTVNQALREWLRALAVDARDARRA